MYSSVTVKSFLDIVIEASSLSFEHNYNLVNYSVRPHLLITLNYSRESFQRQPDLLSLSIYPALYIVDDIVQWPRLRFLFMVLEI